MFNKINFFDSKNFLMYSSELLTCKNANKLFIYLRLTSVMGSVRVFEDLNRTDPISGWPDKSRGRTRWIGNFWIRLDVSKLLELNLNLNCPFDTLHEIYLFVTDSCSEDTRHLFGLFVFVSKHGLHIP